MDCIVGPNDTEKKTKYLKHGIKTKENRIIVNLLFELSPTSMLLKFKKIIELNLSKGYHVPCHILVFISIYVT